MIELHGKWGRKYRGCLAILETENGFIVETYSFPRDEERIYSFESLDALYEWMKENVKTRKELRDTRFD